MNGIMGVLLPQRNSDRYILETLAERQIHTSKWTHQHKPPTFCRTTLNSVKAQSHSSHHFSKRENYNFLGFSAPLSAPCCQHSTCRSLGLSLCSSSPFPSSALLLSKTCWQNGEDSVSLQETREWAIRGFRGPYLPPTQRLHIQLPRPSYSVGI